MPDVSNILHNDLHATESFLSIASLRAPEKIVRSSWHEHAPFAFWLVDKLKPRVVVELGTGDGFSYFTLCQALNAVESEAAIYSVRSEAPRPDGNNQTSGDYIDDYNNQHYTHFSKIMTISLGDALDHFENGSVDLLHINGEVIFEGIEGIVCSWMTKLSSTGVVLLHGTNSNSDIKHFWDEISSQYLAFNFLHCQGLGVFSRARSNVDCIYDLFNASDERKLLVRKFYSRLGSLVSLGFRASEVSKAFHTTLADLQSVSEENELLREQFADLTCKKAEADAESVQQAASLRRELDRIAVILSAERQRAAELSDAILDLRGSHDTELAKLSARLDEAKLGAEEAESLNDKLAQSIAESAAERIAESEIRLQIASELQAHQAKVVEQANALADLSTRYRALEDAFERGRISAQSGLEKARVEVARLKADLDFAVEDASTQREKAIQRTSDVNRINALRLDAERQAFDLSDSLSASRKDATRLQAALTEAVATRASAEETLELAHSTNKLLKGQLERMSDDLTQKEMERTSLASELAQLLGRVQDAEDALRVRSGEHDRAVQRLIAQRHAEQTEKEVLRACLVDAEAALAHVTKFQNKFVETLLPEKVRLKKLARQLLRTGLFDCEWYLRKYPEVGRDRLDAAIHYLRSGFCTGYRPNEFFDTRYYLDHNDDVRRSGINPLFHYFRSGWREGRDPGPDFETEFYLQSNLDVKASGINPLVHFLSYGRSEGRIPVRPNKDSYTNGHRD